MNISLLQKLDRSGNVLWTKRAENVYLVKEKSNQHLQTMSSFPVPTLREFDKNGNDIWEKKYSNTSCFFNGWSFDLNRIDGIVLNSDLMDSTGTVILGIFVMKTDSSGTIQFSNNYQGNWYFDQTYKCSFAKDCGIIVNGRICLDSNSTRQTQSILRLDTLGNVQWMRSYNILDNAWAWDLINTPDFGYASLANLFGTSSNFTRIIKTDVYGKTSCHNDSLILVTRAPIQLTIDPTLHPSVAVTIANTVTSMQQSANTISVVTNCSDTVSGQNLSPCYPCPLPAPVILGNSSVCPGDTAMLTVGGTFWSYSWSPAAPPNSSISVSPLISTTYTVTVTNACGNGSGTKTINLYPPAPSPVISGRDTVCMGSSTVLTASGGVSYSWNNGTTGSSIVVSPTTNTIYTVTLTDANGCKSSSADTTYLAALPILATSSQPSTNCSNSNGSASVTVTNGYAPYQYSWNNGQLTQAITGLHSGTYTVTVTNSNGCNQTDTALIANETLPILSITSISNDRCHGDSTGIGSVNVSGGTPPFMYSWNTNPPQTSATANHLPAGTYTITVTGANGCIQTQSVTITQPSILSLILSSGPACGSQNGSASASGAGGTGPYTYSWQPLGGNSSTATGLSSGTYTCVITDSNGCSNQSTLPVLTYPVPIPDAGSAQTINYGDSISLIGLGGGSYSWSPASSLTCGNCSSPIAYPLSTTTYTLTVTNTFGCSADAFVTISVDNSCTQLFVPNAFSPNGDGENDYECAYGEDCVATMDFSIYDRWGEKVFETNSFKKCWDGTHKGVIMNTGVYIYFLNATLVSGKKVFRKGNLSLIR